MGERESTDKVYSPDLVPYEFSGASGLFSTIASIIVGPIRLLLRVVHNIMILPAGMMASYAEGLLIIGAMVGVIGVIDFILRGRWPLLVSQIPVILLAVKLKATASRATEIALIKSEVEIDTDKVEELCNGIVPELDAIIGKDESNNE